jgi:hypothetical protein
VSSEAAHEETEEIGNAVGCGNYCFRSGTEQRGGETSSSSRDAATCKNACWHLESGEDWAPGGSKTQGGKETAHSVIRLGPGGFSAIEDFVDPAVHLHSLIWWDKVAQRFKTAGCDDLGDQVPNGERAGPMGRQ